MAVAKMETAAEKYRRIAQGKAKAEQLHDVECVDQPTSADGPPITGCGMVWKARPTSIEFWTSSGILPMHLVEVMLESVEKNGNKNVNKVAKQLAPKDVLRSIEFSSRVVRHTAVEPRIADHPSDANDISPDEVMTCCYNTLLRWAMKGGAEAARLGNFPR
jgi:hypothetical protein